MTIKSKIAVYLADVNRAIPNPDRKSNVGALLFEAYVAEELAELAAKRAKAALEALVEQGLIPGDEALREEEGEETLTRQRN